jgi:FAD:protein FMN transferase
MISCSKNEMRRCRPLLGTFVEIAASGLEDPLLNAAILDAFFEVEEVQRRMSVFDESSELCEVNRSAHLQPVRVHESTFNVLDWGLELARLSEGAFDFTVGSTLAQWGLRPASLQRTLQGNWRDIQMLRGQRVRFRCPLAIDLGGIAKGYSVDLALAALRRHNVSAGTVNAGGDLKVFGPEDAHIRLRHPDGHQLVPEPIVLRNAALATTSPCFSRKTWRRQSVSHLVNTADSSAITDRMSVSVRARDCWLADGLTKVVLNAPALAPSILEKFRAEAFVLVA